MSGNRPKLFDDADALDLSGFAPISTPQQAPAPEAVRQISEAGGFPSRAPKAPLPSRYKTGRTVMLNARVTQRAHDRFHAIIEAELGRYQRGEITHRVTLGEVVEWALAALEREMAEGGRKPAS